jgi:hypothetical protein
LRIPDLRFGQMWCTLTREIANTSPTRKQGMIEAIGRFS